LQYQSGQTTQFDGGKSNKKTEKHKCLSERKGLRTYTVYI